MAEKTWGGGPFWGLGYDLDPDWVLTERQKELRAKLIDLCEQELRANALSDRFAGREADGLPEPRISLVPADAARRRRARPLRRPRRALLLGRRRGGDHSLFLGRVVYAHHREGAPLLFHGGRYERLGTSA